MSRTTFVLTSFLLSTAWLAPASHAAPPKPRPEARAKTPLPAILEMFSHASWADVTQAAMILRASADEAIPLLAAMTARDERVHLKDTADLIYPGADQFYGHGYVLGYDLDALGDRAGWLLEEMTFHDFGFSEGVNAFQKEEPAHAKARLAKARAAVRAWMAGPGATATSCFARLKDALVNGNARSQGLAYMWLRAAGPSQCEGFERRAFELELLPTVRQHAADKTHALQQQAQYLLDELDYVLQMKLGEPPR